MAFELKPNRTKGETMTIHNNTQFTLEQIQQFPVLGTTVNKWRERNITLHQHPHDENMVVSVGVTFDRNMTVISEETKQDWVTALDYAAHGKVYTSN